MSNEKSAPYPYNEKLGIQLPPEIEQEIKNLVSGGQKIPHSIELSGKSPDALICA